MTDDGGWLVWGLVYDWQVNLKLTKKQWSRIMGASAVTEYKRWEQLHAGQWHDVINDASRNVYGSPLGVSVC